MVLPSVPVTRSERKSRLTDCYKVEGFNIPLPSEEGIKLQGISLILGEDVIFSQCWTASILVERNEPLDKESLVQLDMP